MWEDEFLKFEGQENLKEAVKKPGRQGSSPLLLSKGGWDPGCREHTLHLDWQSHCLACVLPSRVEYLVFKSMSLSWLLEHLLEGLAHSQCLLSWLAYHLIQ